MATRNKRIRFMDNQLAKTVNVSTSLIDSAFPLSNMLDDGRFKITRFRGTFIIDNTNNQIYINDGSDKSATITNGEYVAADLATEIQTQLNSVSTNWTCTYSTTTYKFDINRTSGTDTIRGGFAVTNDIWDTIGYRLLGNEPARPADEQRNHTKEYIEIDLGTNANDVGFFGLVSPVDTAFSVSGFSTVELLASNVQNWASPARTITPTINDFGIFAFLDDDTGGGYRFWRLEITDRLNINGPGFDFSHLYLGTYTTLANRNVNTGFSKKWVDPSVTFQAQSGATYADIRQRYLQLDSLTINYMDQGDRKNLEQIFYDFGKHKPLWIAFDPLEDCSTIEELTRYVYFNGEPTFSHFRNSVYSMSFSVRDAL